MMIPPKLQHGDNLANLFEKFNTVIDYLREIRLVAGNGIRINRLPAGTTIESTATAAGGTPAGPAGDEYNGYFKIVNVSDSEHKIMVVDGNTWDPGTQTSGPSICRINGTAFPVNAWTSQAITGRFYVVLQYHADGTNESVKIRLFQAIPPDHMTIKFHQIGEVYVQDGMLKIIQRHTSGTILLTGGLSTEAFGVSPIFAEPPESGVFPSTEFTIRVNAGVVICGSQYIQVMQQDFTSPAPYGRRSIISVIVTVSVSNETPNYSAALVCTTDIPSVPAPNWIRQIASCNGMDLYQEMTGNIVVSGVWV